GDSARFVYDENGEFVGVKTTLRSGKTEGIVYKRTNIKTGKEYVGQAKSIERYILRQKEHATKNGQQYEFEELGRAKAGSELDILEQTMINLHGGLGKEGGTLENLINKIRESKWELLGIPPVSGRIPNDE
ncbi:hypothetical protein ABRS97_27985, partial [Paenibacillus sp. SI92]